MGGRVWLWVIPFVLLYGIWSFFGFDLTGPASHDLALFLETRGEEFFQGNWVWFGVIVVQLVFVSFLGRTCSLGGFCCRACKASSEGATL